MTNLETPFIEESSPTKSIGIVNGAVFLMVLGLGVVIYLTPLKAWLAEGELIKVELARFGLGAPLVFAGSAAVLTAIGIPRLLLCSLAGMVFGLASGLLWSEIATVLGSYATFVFVRWRGRDYALQRFPRLRRFSKTLEGRGVLSVVVIRQLPMSGFYNNVMLGLTPVKHRDFIVGSLIGYLPLGITACLIGTGLIQADVSKSVQYIVLAMLCSFGLGFLLKRALPQRG